MEVKKLQIFFFFPFLNILDQSSHAYIQPFFHLRIIIFEIRYILRVGIKVCKGLWSWLSHLSSIIFQTSS